MDGSIVFNILVFSHLSDLCSLKCEGRSLFAQCCTKASHLCSVTERTEKQVLIISPAKDNKMQSQHFCFNTITSDVR